MSITADPQDVKLYRAREIVINKCSTDGCFHYRTSGEDTCPCHDSSNCRPLPTAWVEGYAEAKELLAAEDANNRAYRAWRDELEKKSPDTSYAAYHRSLIAKARG